jgi:hypothetical protein
VWLGRLLCFAALAAALVWPGWPTLRDAAAEDPRVALGVREDPMLLFGGPDQRDFLGCLNCDRSEPFSIWNERSDHGSTDHPHSIWNRSGPYGSSDGPHSPWSLAPETVPVVVDRAGNLLGYFTANASHPGRVRDAYLLWIVDRHDWIVDHLDAVRLEFAP